MILRRIFEKQEKGFFVDVGAHHPKRFSNTYFFYEIGWNGINIDAMPGSMKIFNKIRTRDINIEKPISNKKEILEYHIFDEPALNGFSKEFSEKREKLSKHSIIERIKLETTTLEEILDNNLPDNQTIDFLSIDAEGLDFQVLNSNNFEKYKPRLILIESVESPLSTINEHEITIFLKKNNYSIYAKSVNTLFYMIDDFYI
jgi:FkbM family methyltransferase